MSVCKKIIIIQKKKEEEKAKEKELNELFKVAVSQPKVPVGNCSFSFYFSSADREFVIWY